MDESEIFRKAVSLSEDERSDYLDRVCAHNEGLRQEIESLIRADQTDSFLNGHLPRLADDATSSASDDSERTVGELIDRYVLREQIGQGGMGIVWAAEQRQPIHRKVALKVIKPGMDSGAILARFEAERQALAMMDHESIAKVLDAGTTENGRPYFVMELIQGQPITEYCDEKRLSIQDRLELFVTVCRAVQHAHQKGVIHRDLKPSNILVTEQDGKAVAKIIDFGVAKALHQNLTDRTIYTNFQSFLGTPLYASPEQATLSNVDVDTRSDVYSLGVLLYELLTGRTPIDRDHLEKAALEEMFRLLKEMDPPKPSTRISTMGDAASSVSQSRGTEPTQLGRIIRGDLDWIVMKSLEKDRSRRYESASDFAQDILRYLNNNVVTARPPSSAYKLRKYIQRNRAAVVASSLVSVAIAIGGVSAGFSWRQTKEALSVSHGLLTELRAYMSEQAADVALSGNSERALRDIEKARAYEVSADRCDILEAIAYFYGGQIDKAIGAVQPVLERNPKSVAANCILTMSSLHGNTPADTALYASRLTDAKPVDFLGKLLLAQTKLYRDPDGAKTITDELLRNHPDWAALRALHGAVLIQHATDLTNSSQVVKTFETALANLDTAQQLLGKNRYVVTERMVGLIHALDLANAMELPQSDEWKTQLQELVGDTAVLERKGDWLESVRHYAIAKLNNGVTEAQWHELANRGVQRDFIMKCMRFYGQGNDNYKRLMIENEKKYPMEHEIVSLYVDTEKYGTDRNPAIELIERYISEFPDVTMDAHSLAIEGILYSGDLPAAQAYAKRFVKQPPAMFNRWQMRVMEYVAEPTAEKREDLLSRAGPFTFANAHIRLTVGLVHFSQGDFESAKEHFRAVIEAGTADWMTYCYSDAILRRLEIPGWPEWIKPQTGSGQTSQEQTHGS